MFKDFVSFVHEIYGTNDYIPLHEPRFIGNEKKYLLDTIDSTYVSSVGPYVDNFEKNISEYTGAKYAIATVNGTAALHISLKVAGVLPKDEVITQSLTFIATCNAIRYCGAIPLFVDVDRETLGLSAESLKDFLNENCEIRNDGFCWNIKSNYIVRACVPMHTFGLPSNIVEISKLCALYNIVLIEDAAESLGSTYNSKHMGTFGKLAALSFNGNKIITTGGGGMILTDDENLAVNVKHFTTTARIKHNWDISHDAVAYNYRLPNLNAALGVAQLESLPDYVNKKRKLATKYQDWGQQIGMKFVFETSKTKTNYWLNTVIAESKAARNEMLAFTNSNKVMTRPVWTPMHKLPMFQNCFNYNLSNTEWLADRIVNVPSSVCLDI